MSNMFYLNIDTSTTLHQFPMHSGKVHLHFTTIYATLSFRSKHEASIKFSIFKIKNQN